MKKFCEKASRNYQLKLRESEVLDKNTFNAYETSWETEYLDSERNRIIFSELIDWKRKADWRDEYEKIINSKNINNDTMTKQITTDNSKEINDHDDEGEEERVAIKFEDNTKWSTKFDVKSNLPSTLREIALNVLVKNFNGEEKIDERITCQDAIDFGLDADISLSSFNLLQFENREFWKRKVQAELNNLFDFEKLKKTPNINWKQISIELSFRNFVENLESDSFTWSVDREKILNFVDKLKDYIENLQIRKLKLKNELNDEDFPVVNYSSDDNEHVSLEFLKNLTKLKRLSIEFGPGTIKKGYHRKLFLVATTDIKNLSLALRELKALEKLEIKHSNLEEELKIFYLISSIDLSENIKILNLTHCNITSKSGVHFENFLTKNSSIEEIELRGNNLGYEFCKHFANGILNFKGQLLKYLGLSFNQILLNGLKFIMNSMIEKDNVKMLNVCGCEGGKSDSYEEFIDKFCTLLQYSKKLKLLDFSSNFIPNADLRKKIIEAHNKNSNIFFIFNPNDFPSSEPKVMESFLMYILNRRTQFYNENPILKKDTFTEDDEIECIKWLRRIKNPSLLKYKRNFVPSEVKVKHKNRTLERISEQDYENFLFTFHPSE